MIGLFDYIDNMSSMIGESQKTPRKNHIDGHVHLFSDSSNLIDYQLYTSKNPFSKVIGFLDIEPKTIKNYESCLDYYKDFIDNCYNENNMILLAASTKASDMIDIYNKYPNIIKGFGEVKCYDEWSGVKLGLKGFKQYWDVFKLAGEKHLPVYIHYSLNSQVDVDRLDRCLSKFPSTTFVLCHCGTDKYQADPSFAIHSTIYLMQRHINLWTDITYTALDYFSVNPMLLYQFPSDKIIMGTDFNPFLFEKNKTKTIWSTWKKTSSIDQFISSDFNINHLFSRK